MSTLPLPLLLAGLAGLGLVIGSFLNVVVHRIPAGLSVLSPGSACPHCEAPVRSYDNIPVIAWLLLRGRCRDCAAPIHWRYPAVELGTAALFVAVGIRLGWSPYLLAVLIVAAAGVSLTLIDLNCRRLPFPITGAAAVGAIAMLSVDAASTGSQPVGAAVASTAVWGAVYGGVWLATAGRGMGLGDVALAPLLGLTLGWLGWGPSLVGLLGGFLLGAVAGVALMMVSGAHRRSRVPHGPFMLAGAAVGLFAGEPLWLAYLQLVRLA